jgi:predicted glycosyltransferase involved in capsule biosynthesis
MKANLKDVTFFILIRLDSIQRLENIIAVTNYLCRYFQTNLVVWEASSYNNGILKSLLNRNVIYKFIEDKDPVLHKTKYYNQILLETRTPFFSIWDADAISDKKYIEEAITLLRSGDADVVYPYNGIFLETTDIIRNLFLKKKSMTVLHKNQNKMNFLYDKILYGGAVIIITEKFVWAGMDNEAYYGWGNEDFDRFYRFQTLQLKVHRTDNCLYHLSHPRGLNSKYRSGVFAELSSGELSKTTNSSLNELIGYVKKQSYADKRCL